MQSDIQSRASFGLIVSNVAISFVHLRAKFLQTGINNPTFIRVTGETPLHAISGIQRIDVGIYQITFTQAILGNGGDPTNNSYAYISTAVGDSNFYMNVQANPISSTILGIKVLDQRGYPSDINGYLFLFIDFELRS